MANYLTVGGKKLPFDEAVAFARKYLSGEGNWAYPAYDAYPGHSGPEVGRQDLLTVALLNAHQRPIESYYGLESLLPLINEPAFETDVCARSVPAELGMLRNRPT